MAPIEAIEHDKTALMLVFSSKNRLKTPEVQNSGFHQNLENVQMFTIFDAIFRAEKTRNFRKLGPKIEKWAQAALSRLICCLFCPLSLKNCCGALNNALKAVKKWG